MRRRYVFSGRVQGVGFRATTRHIAQAYPITGWVRNDMNGDVTLEAQGESPEIDQFIAELRHTMARNIVTMSVSDLDPVNDEQGFHIAR